MITRRNVLAFLPTLSRAATGHIALKLAHSAPPDHPLHIRLGEAAEHIRRDTNGGVSLDLFPFEQLGSQLDALRQVRLGAIDFIAISGLILSSLIPMTAISGIPFAFRDTSAVWTALDGPLGSTIRAAIEQSGDFIAIEKSFDNGFRQITTSTKVINAPSDLIGLKIRIPPSALWVALFSALGASPTVASVNEIYSALKTGLVDGEENPLALIWGYKLYEVQRHCALTRHLWDGLWLVGNRRRLERLPALWRAVVEGHLNAAARSQRTDLADLNTSLRGRLTQLGLRFNEPATLPFQTRLRATGFYTQWKAKFPPAVWAQLEAVAGSLR